ncbi:MAG: hypothetical protein KDB69_04075 [Acidimicrobiia bacterium]|nr:hypothetical protein [Acidimicrobiia bacterium]
MISVEQLEGEIIGVPFPVGEYTIEPYEHWLCADAVGSPPLPQGVAHPMFAFYVAQGGMGVTLEELFNRCHSSSDDGVMLGEVEMDWNGSFEVGATYEVTGGFTKVVRKESARLGIMDLITFELVVTGPDGTVTATVKNTFVYPRRES